MTYIFEIKETKESLPLIAHLKTLKYVKDVFFDYKALAKAVKAAEKGESISWAEFNREAQTWKSKFTK